MKKIILSACLITVASGCAHEAVKTQFVSASPVTVTTLNAQSEVETTSIPANQSFELKGNVSRVEGKGYLPLVVVAPGASLSDPAPVQLSLRPVADWKSETTDQYISNQMDVLYIDLLQIIAAAKDRKTEVSLKKIDSVIERFPKLASAYYVKAQVEVLSGRSANALSNLDLAIKLRPGFMEAIALQQQLKGKN